MRGDTGLLRVGIAGFGMAAQTFHVPLLRSVSGFALRAVASSRPEDARAVLGDVRVHRDAALLCRDPELDLIVIATPNDTHAPLAEMALRAGKHVVVDKPLALNAAEARHLFATARENERIVTVFQNRRWDGDYLTVADVLRSGALGRLVQFESHFDRFRPKVPDRWRDRPGPGAGLWYDLGPHLVDQALQLFGVPANVYVDRAALRDGAVADDYFHAVLGYDRLRVVLHAAALAAARTPRFALHGTAGSFVVDGLDPQEAQLKAGMRPGESGWGSGAHDGILSTPGGEERVALRPGDYRRFYDLLRDAIAAGTALPVMPQEALGAMHVLDLGRRSSELGRAMPMHSA